MTKMAGNARKPTIHPPSERNPPRPEIGAFRRTFMMAHVITPRTRVTHAGAAQKGEAMTRALLPLLAKKNLPITKMAGTQKS